MTRLYPIILLLITLAQAQIFDLDKRRQIIFPNIPGYETLTCDLHMHTVFSDGYVWPTIRVDEALKDNLDAIAVTEHIEYQPYKNDIPHPDRSRAYEIEKKAAEKEDLIVINGSEITRRMPPGHANAIFLQDANKLIVEDSIVVFREAKKQGAFIFWNHPHWTAQKKDGTAQLTDIHRMLIKEGLLEGIEVVNDLTYSDEVLQIALDNNLTILGSSDVHGLVDWRYKIPQGGHRPVTLVFALEKSETGIKDGLSSKRTVVYFENLLIGRNEFLVPLINASITADTAAYQKDAIILDAVLHNLSSAEFTLQNTSKYKFQNAGDLVTLKAHSDVKLEIKTLEHLQEILLTFKVLNAVNAPNTHPDISIKIMTAQNMQKR